MSSDDLRNGRLALGLSLHALAERTGLSTAAIEYLEEHGDLPQRSPARRVREALGLPEASTPDSSPPTTAADDVVVVEALIADAGGFCSREQLADALNWTLPRVSAAIQALHDCLEPTGQTLIRDAEHRYALGARRALIDTEAHHRAHEWHLGELDPLTASVLYQILRGPRENRRWTSFTTIDEHDAIRHLIAADLIDEHHDRFRPTDRSIAWFGIVLYDDGYWRYPQIDLDETKTRSWSDPKPRLLERRVQ